MTSLNILKQS